jgi:hypothetical protein
MSKKIYTIPCVWTVTSHLKVEAENLSDALIEAENAPLPSAADYLEGSFEIDYPVIPYVNDHLTKEEKCECNVEVI